MTGHSGGDATGPHAQSEDTAAFYDDMWRKYAHLDAVNPAAIHRRRQVVRAAARYAPGARTVLDVGCGQGQLVRLLAAQFPSAEIRGCDVSEQSIIDSRRHNPTFDLFTVDLVADDFETKHAKYIGKNDLVVCSEVVEHIAESALAVKRLRLLTAPGGTIIVTVPGGRMSRFDKAIGHVRHYTTTMLHDLLADADLEIVSVKAWGFPFHSLYREAVRVAGLFAVEDESKANGAPKKQGAVAETLIGAAHTVFGKSLNGMFYLNLSRWGEQMVAVARRR